MNKCEKCGFLHYRTDPCRNPKVRIGTEASDNAITTPKSSVSAEPPSDVKVQTQSAAEKLGSPNAQHEALGNVAGVTQVAGSGVSPPVTRQAGTQALPVDTNLNGDSQVGRQAAKSREIDGSIPSPQTKFDRKTWMREYQRNYMRNVYRPKLKASKALSSQPQKGE